jgi:hypothetical protein
VNQSILAWSAEKCKVNQWIENSEAVKCVYKVI